MYADYGDGQPVGLLPRNALGTPSVNGLKVDAERSGEIAASWRNVTWVLDGHPSDARQVVEWEPDHWSGLS